jgi:hypothetical protein
MLHTDPVTSDPASRHTRVYRRRPPDVTEDSSGVSHEFDAEAFHWGSLTTGHWLTALWILLGPFAFANVAGWMSNRTGKMARLTVRLVGLALTSLFVAQIGYLFLEIAPALAPSSWRRPLLLTSVPLYAAFFVVGIVIWLSTQSHFQGLGWGQRLRLAIVPARRHLLPPLFWPRPDLAESQGQWADPAGSPMASPALWGEHAMLHRIRRIHLTAGLTVVTALMAAAAGQEWLQILVVAIAALAIILTILTTTHPERVLVQHLTAWAPMSAIAGFALGYWQLVASATPPAPWPGLHVTTFVVALSLGVFSLSALLAGRVSLGAIVIGTLFGASLGVGVGLIAERYAGINELTDNGAGWVAVAMLLLVLTLTATALGLSFGGQALPGEGKVMALVRRVTTRGPTLFTVAGLYGLTAGIIAFAAGCIDTCTPAALRPPEPGSTVYLVAIGAMGLVAALLAVRTWAINKSLAIVIFGGGGLLVTLFALGRLPEVEVAGFQVDLSDLVDLSKILIVILPALLVIRSMIGSIRRGTSNRQVGILWDVASLWPRWFHPLAPPAYGPKVIESLIERLKENPPDLLEAHSQGSVIAVLALSQLDEPGDISLLTYGSPIGLLYARMFPEVRVEALVAGVEARLEGRWQNLWRPTDPLGGAPAGLVDGDHIVDDGTGHSGYELTRGFREARHRLLDTT